MAVNKSDSKVEKDENLIAVVMADDFDEQFGILTEHKPKCLLPLANKEMIEYTLEFMQSSNVQDCYVYCSKHVQQIKEHLIQKHWIKSNKNEPLVRRSKMNVHMIADENCHSFGDAMRDLDEKGILRSHFILTSADVVSNINIDSLIKEHTRRYNENKNTTLTMVYQYANPGHQNRSKSQEVLLVTKRENNRIVYHSRAKNSFEKKSKGNNRVRFPLDLFSGNTNEETDIRYDLADTGITICAPTVPLQFAERFDCQTLDDFIKGSIEDDIADHFLFASIIGDAGNGNVCTGYASKVADFLTYLTVSYDILNRWAYPLVPEANISSIGKKVYTVARHNVYKAANVTLMMGSVLQEDVIVGENTVIGENSVLCNAALGRSCKLGSNVSILSSIIHDNVAIGANSQLVGCIVGQGVTIGENVVIHDKSIIGPGTSILDNCKPIKPLTWIVSEKPDDGFGSDSDAANSDELELGPKAFLYKLPDDACNSDSENDDENRDSSPDGLEEAWGRLIPSEDEGGYSSSSLSDSDTDSISVGDPDPTYLDTTNQFYEEVFESLQRGFEDKTEDGNLVLEVNASRHAYAVTATEVVQRVVMSVFGIASSASKDDSDANALLGEVRTKLNFFKGLIQRYVKTELSEIDCLKGLEMYCWENQNFLNVSSKTIHYMFDKLDMLSEEAILAWYYDENDDEDGGSDAASKANQIISKKLRQKLKPLIDWLNEDDDEESEEDDD